MTLTHRYGENGIIGWSGKWYPCEFGDHLDTMRELKSADAPFCSVHFAEACFFVDDVWNDGNERHPSYAQFETLMDWCTDRSELFEEIIMSVGWDYYVQQ